MEEKYKVYYELTKDNYNELNETYHNLIDKGSKLLTFMTILSGGLLFLVKWILDNYNSLGKNYGWILFITIILLVVTVLELGLLLIVMFVDKNEKLRIKTDDDQFFLANSDDAIYVGLATRYSETNERNFITIKAKSRKLGYAQKGLFTLLLFTVLGISIIFLIK